jgi:hypothetical protein
MFVEGHTRNAAPRRHRGLTATRVALAILIIAAASPAAAQVVSVNFFHTSGTVATGEEAGVVQAAGWNNVLVPGGFGVDVSRCRIRPGHGQRFRGCGRRLDHVDPGLVDSPEVRPPATSR